jgi:hypothetical protein
LEVLGFPSMAMAMKTLSYAVVDTPVGPFTLGACESAIHKAFFGKPPTDSVKVDANVANPVLILVLLLPGFPERQSQNAKWVVNNVESKMLNKSFRV